MANHQVPHAMNCMILQCPRAAQVTNAAINVVVSACGRFPPLPRCCHLSHEDKSKCDGSVGDAVHSTNNF